MKYIKGTQTYTLEGLQLIKLSLNDGGDFTERPWALRSPDGSESILVHDSVAFTPDESWGAVLPTTSSLNFIDLLNKQELVLHPECWDQYISSGIIDENGNKIKK